LPFASQQAGRRGCCASTARQQWKLLAAETLGSSLVGGFSEGPTLAVIFPGVGVLSAPPAEQCFNLGRLPQASASRGRLQEAVAQAPRTPTVSWACWL